MRACVRMCAHANERACLCVRMLASVCACRRARAHACACIHARALACQVQGLRGLSATARELQQPQAQHSARHTAQSRPPPVQHGHLCSMATCAIWRPVQYGHLHNMATCAICPPVQYGHLNLGRHLSTRLAATLHSAQNFVVPPLHSASTI